MKVDGNVIHADFGKRETALPQLEVSITTLFADEYAALVRITYRIGQKVFIQHVCKGVGVNA